MIIITHKKQLGAPNFLRPRVLTVVTGNFHRKGENYFTSRSCNKTRPLGTVAKVPRITTSFSLVSLAG